MIYEIETMETINERISYLIQYLKMKPSQFARLIGTSAQNVDNMLKGAEPRSEMLVKITTATSINLNWLLTGKGEMLLSNEVDKIVSEIQEPYLINARLAGALADQDIIELPLLDAKAVASFSENITGAMSKIATDKSWPVIKMPGHVYTKAFVMEIVGDSMLPNFRSGMKVIIRQVPEGRWGGVTGIHALSIKGGMFTIKRIIKNEDNILLIKADNPEYPEQQKVQLSDILIMFRVGEIVYAPPIQDL